MNYREVSVPLRGSNGEKANGLVVQRRCACGNHVRGGDCEQCRRKKAVQRKDGETAAPVARSLGTRTMDSGSPGSGTDLSAVAARGAAAAPRLRIAQRVQRQAASAPAVAEPTPAPEAAPEPAATGPAESLIVDDDAVELQPGQMRKTAFLDQLQRTVCAETDAALAASGRDSRGCPYLEGWFRFYRGQSAGHVEAALRRYAPEARAARSAADYVPLVAARVRQAVTRWAETGEITGVPEGMPPTPAGSLAALGGLVGAIGSALGRLMFKERDGGAQADDDPAAVQRSLGGGRQLESGVRGRMERAFGRSFAGVRTHTDATAHRVSAEQNARAFTVGRDVAFGAGEYRPGTMVGDALIAHELAHVVQQGGASPETQGKPAGGASYGALERDADNVAVGAVASLWGGVKGSLAGVGQSAMPALKSGLRLSRCRREQDRPAATTDLAALCDRPKCLERSACPGDDCKAEAQVISDTYVRRVHAIRRPDMPNRGDIHWGWLCYEWAGLLKREFEKLSLSCWQIRWVGIVSDSSGDLLHNYIFTSLGEAANDRGPVRDCGLILDPWRTGTAVVYGGAWDWHRWNYIHDTRNDVGRVYQDGRWQSVFYPVPPTPDEPAPRNP